MTFISLRKPEPEPEPEELEEEFEELEEEQPAEAAQEPIGYLAAVAAGVRGWFTWCSHRIGAGRTVFVHGVTWWACDYYGGWVIWAVAGGQILAIASFVPRSTIDRLVERIEKADPDLRTTQAVPAVDSPPVAPVDPLVTLAWDLISTAPGVHLKTLTERASKLAEKEGRPAPTPGAVEAALKALGIPLRKSVRDHRRKVNRGVHREDLTAWEQAPSPTPDPPPTETL